MATPLQGTIISRTTAGDDYQNPKISHHFPIGLVAFSAFIVADEDDDSCDCRCMAMRGSLICDVGGSISFEDPKETKDFKKTIQRIYGRQGYTTFGYMMMQMVVAHGGRCAERVVFGDNITDGGTDDLEQPLDLNYY